MPKGGLDAAGKKLKAEIEKAKEQTKMERLKALREAKAASNAKLAKAAADSGAFDSLFTSNRKGAPVDAVKKFLENGGKITKIPAGETAAKAARKPAGAPKAAPAATPAPAKKAKPTTASAPKKGTAKSDKPKKVCKADIVEQMLLAKKGATRAELFAVTGWPTGANLKLAALRAKKKLVELGEGRFGLI
jgi:hypothetical protein